MNILQRYKKNEIGRDFIVGDMHGCYDAFQKCMEDISFNGDKDRMFSVGDLVDRGKQNMECLRLIEQPWFYCVRGNHEDMMLTSVLEHYEHYQWERNGGAWTHEEDITGLEDLCRKVRRLPLAMEVETSYGKIGICHADVPSDWATIPEALPENDYEYDNMRQKLTWGRSKIRAGNLGIIKNIDYVVSGHTPVATMVSMGNVLYIDTGAVFAGQELLNGKVLDGWLSVINIDDVPRFVEECAWPKVKKQLRKKGKGLHD